MPHKKTRASILHSVGLLEAMCFQGIDTVNYWYMKGDYLYHYGPINQILHKRRLDRTITNTYSSTVWEMV